GVEGGTHEKSGSGEKKTKDRVADRALHALGRRRRSAKRRPAPTVRPEGDRVASRRWPERGGGGAPPTAGGASPAQRGVKGQVPAAPRARRSESPAPRASRRGRARPGGLLLGRSAPPAARRRPEQVSGLAGRWRQPHASMPEHRVCLCLTDPASRSQGLIPPTLRELGSAPARGGSRWSKLQTERSYQYSFSCILWVRGCRDRAHSPLRLVAAGLMSG
ncbi:hypothetical protein DJ526_08305, partial [Sulfolobus sp. A20-N-G8]